MSSIIESQKCWLEGASEDHLAQSPAQSGTVTSSTIYPVSLGASEKFLNSCDRNADVKFMFFLTVYQGVTLGS